jgi:2-polyprenyl-6-hydroxyphenyl methylase/3-demethylubiquinone-9 3-methyltransferase
MALSRTSSETNNATSIDPAEVQRFAAMAEEWWDPAGKFRPLHELNPVRLRFLRERLGRWFARDSENLGLTPFAGLSALDIGCGGGLITEPMARLGARVTGIDAASRNVHVAALHAERAGLAIDYRSVAAEDLAATGAQFDIVLALEILEHVADLDVFLDACARLTRPGGALVFATINRTPQAWLLAIAGAEYVLGWLPRGTHRWDKFVRPSELAAGLRRNAVSLRELAGVHYRPFSSDWALGRDLAVNYMAFAIKPAE